MAAVNVCQHNKRFELLSFCTGLGLTKHLGLPEVFRTQLNCDRSRLLANVLSLISLWQDYNS